MLVTSAGPSSLPPAVPGSGRAVRRSQDPVPSTERGFAEPALNAEHGAVPAIAGHGLRAPGRVCPAPPAFSSPSSHK